MFSKAQYEDAREIVYRSMQPTLQYAWPSICEWSGCETWIKHENHTPIGAFKLRGGLVLMDRLQLPPDAQGVITATRGNHGQSIPFAAQKRGIATTIVVPTNNSKEKNSAMLALGAELLEIGTDFNEAAEAAAKLSGERNLMMLPSYHEDLVMGVSTYAHELFIAAGELDAVYVPIGMGSGVSGVISARDILGYKTEVIGVVAERANAYQRSFVAGTALCTESANTFADGMAVRVPHPQAVEVINRGVARIVSVSEGEIADAMHLYYTRIHNVAEGAGAAALAALGQERPRMRGKRVGVILSGGNVDLATYRTVLAGQVPVA